MDFADNFNNNETQSTLPENIESVKFDGEYRNFARHEEAYQ